MNSTHDPLLRHGALKLEYVYFDSRKNIIPVGGLIVMLLVPLLVLMA